MMHFSKGIYLSTGLLFWDITIMNMSEDWLA